jgi:GH43 family beta-xylosidase
MGRNGFAWLRDAALRAGQRDQRRWGQANHALTWTNPIVPQRADPHVFRHTDGYYYLAATVPRYDCIELRRSQTIGGLATAEPKVVWRRPAQGAMAGPIWAPEIHFIQGKWYVYYSAGEGGKPWDRIRMFVMENESANPLAGEWTVLGQIKTKWDSFSLDATTFEHQGERYYVWTQVEPGKQGSCIMIAKMESPTALAEEQVILSRPELPWEQRVHWVNEAPAALVRHGKVFIAYSASATDHNYCMGLLTADADANLWIRNRGPNHRSRSSRALMRPASTGRDTTPLPPRPTGRPTSSFITRATLRRFPAATRWRIPTGRRAPRCSGGSRTARRILGCPWPTDRIACQPQPHKTAKPSLPTHEI